MDPSTTKPRHTARINALPVVVDGGETLLDAALRSGVDFPNSCRVGGCGSCKCRLVEGKVKELTETAYLLTDAEIEAGYILACQSVAVGDVRVEVDLSRVAVQLGIAQRYADADLSTVARNQVLDAIEDKEYLQVRQGVLQWQRDQSGVRGGAELAVLDAQRATFDMTAKTRRRRSKKGVSSMHWWGWRGSR